MHGAFPPSSREICTTITIPVNLQLKVITVWGIFFTKILYRTSDVYQQKRPWQRFESTFLTVPAAPAISFFPTPVDPVNVIFRTCAQDHSSGKKKTETKPHKKNLNQLADS